MRTLAAGLAVALGCLAAAEAGAVEAGAGASGTAGSGGYRRAALSADAAWTGRKVEPYIWAETSFSRDLRQFALGGGAWNNWTDAERGKAGLGFAGGRYDSGQSVSSLIAELGAEKDLDAATLGAEWRLTYGTLSSSRGTPALENAGNSRSRGRRGTADELDSFAVNSLAAYGRKRLDLGVIGLRLGIDAPSGGDAIVSETLSLRIPVGTRVWVTPAVTLEQGGSDAVYGSLSVYCRL